tara:strand:- start:1901 stop:2038 length:138 start_codon:yes stop_codon:yes gene_type:complete
MTKLTMITVNGRTIFVQVPVCKDGKVRADIWGLFGLRREDCLIIG